MDAGVDTGDIVHQRALDALPSDTAHTLYQRLMRLELEVFREAWPAFAAGRSARRPQDHAAATVHKRRDLADDAVRRIDLDIHVKAGDLIRKLRALTTDRWDEAAYFEADGKRYRVRVEIDEQKGPAQ
jgi:methionyl-tRNA formyltransferase